MKAVLFALLIAPAASSKPKVQAWYVNAKGKIDRDVCIRTQLEDMNIQPRRFTAIKLEKCFGPKAPDFGTCIRNQGYGDCIKSGMQWGALGAHGSERADLEGTGVADYTRHLGITSNWCSHKRLMQQIEKDEESADYHLIFEDDVILKPGFKKAVADFIENYNGTWNDGFKKWDLVQIDPFGTTCDDHKVDEFRGASIYKPTPHHWLRDMTPLWRQTHQQWIEKNRCNEYWGYHAILVRKSAMDKIVANMEDNPTVPLDWLTGQYPNAIAWSPGIASNPEEMHSGGKKFKLPSYCKKEVMRSSLSGFMQKKEEVDTHYVTSGILHKWADTEAAADQRLAVAPEK
eukprot:gnl/MRDRNA2_/MRDRNA2_85401_c0_seq5.p1 gnl/MRDRNA2_/MRDRNA2_85401_c0~~gnl/MRDRNA2_/MRDRNA2_85401_c0_seq5.p1  ORF type:complete len:344 (+),score=89.05 gnl/MRDRNA2_/MRDRNA2_85401_c0_seq5:72-1103(+)